jgi:hypothetical protein
MARKAFTAEEKVKQKFQVKGSKYICDKNLQTTMALSSTEDVKELNKI